MSAHEPFDMKIECDRLMLACTLLESIDLDEIIATVSRADALGPFLDPTAYGSMLDRKGNMHDVARIARLAKTLVAEMSKLREELAA